MTPYPTAEFLAKLRLVHGNPFAETQAEREDRLSQYFIDLDAFYRIMDTQGGPPSSSILSAARGCGKSANRRNVERWLTVGLEPSFKGHWPWREPVLVISYLKFDRIIKRVQGRLNEINPEDHVAEVLRNGIASLLDYLNTHPNTLSGLPPKSVLAKLGFYIQEFSPLCTEVELDDEPAEVNTRSPNDVTSNRLDVARLVKIACAHANAAQYLRDEGAIGIIQQFVDLLHSLGLKMAVVLVDGVDENWYTAASPARCADLLAPLMAETGLMQLPDLVFKFFLPDDVVLELEQRRVTRVGERLKWFEIRWTEESLINHLLANRLAAYSDNKLTDLGEFATPEAQDVSRVLARSAHNNPRNLLRLCEWLLIHFEESYHKVEQEAVSSGRSKRPDTKKEPLFTPQIVEAAIASFEKERTRMTDASQAAAPVTMPSQVVVADVQPTTGLKITADFRIAFQGRIISVEKLRPKEYLVLKYFLDNPNRLIGREEIGVAVWKEDWDNRFDWSLDQTLVRLRKKTGPGFIETVRGIGFIFHPEPKADSSS